MLLTASEADPWVPLARVHETAAAFRAMGAQVRLRLRPGSDHLVDSEELAATRELLSPLTQ